MLTPYERNTKCEYRFYLGGIAISATQWRMIVRMFGMNMRRAKRIGRFNVPAVVGVDMFPHLFGNPVGYLRLSYHPGPTRAQMRVGNEIPF
jgi:hypothetical protein